MRHWRLRKQKYSIVKNRIPVINTCVHFVWISAANRRQFGTEYNTTNAILSIIHNIRRYHITSKRNRYRHEPCELANEICDIRIPAWWTFYLILFLSFEEIALQRMTRARTVTLSFRKRFFFYVVSENFGNIFCRPII